MNAEQLPGWLRTLWFKFAGSAALREVQANRQVEHIYTLAEFEAAKADAGFTDGFHGTYRTPDGSSYLYTKPCHQVATEQQAIESLAFVRFATARGILYPGTSWSAYRTADDQFQLFAITPKLDSWHRDREPIPGQQLMHGVVADGDFDEDSHVAEWMRRLDPGYTTYAEHPGSLTGLLNWCEAIHRCNWGWDAQGNLYPIDVEVVDVAGPDKQLLTHSWYEQQHQAVE